MSKDAFPLFYSSTADVLLDVITKDEETLNIDMVWDIIDRYQEAIILAREQDLECEAIANAMQGVIFDKILKMKTKAKERFRRSIEFANALKPKIFTDEGS
jgi:hypothetical protein